MKTNIALFALIAACCLLVLSGTALAVDGAPLGQSHFNLKAGYLNFTDSAAEDLDIDEGWYVGTEGFFNVGPNLYLGGEIGYGETEGENDFLGVEVDTELTYIPVEINLKYAAALTPQAVVAFGAGGSYNYSEIDVSTRFSSDKDDEWLLGAQIFGDFTFTADSLLLGVQAKYQTVEENMDNWRVTGSIGYRF